MRSHKLHNLFLIGFLIVLDPASVDFPLPEGRAGWLNSPWLILLPIFSGLTYLRWNGLAEIRAVCRTFLIEAMEFYKRISFVFPA